MNGLTPGRARAILAASEILCEHGFDRQDAVALVMGIRLLHWSMDQWAALRRALAQRLADSMWSRTEIVEAMRSDRATVAKWLGRR